MCGISGIWSQSEESYEHLLKCANIMSNSLFKRGPDAGGYWSDKNCGLIISHRRLSIIDLSESGSQPMLSKNKNLILSFNGEIYNHSDLKKELNLIDLKGTSDTEIFLAAIENWGLKRALEKSYGMFALALWNRKNKSLTLARDRFGEKPLYWGYVKLKEFQRRVFVFTSDLSSLWSIPNLKRKININAFSHFIKYSYVSAPDSIQEDIYQLEAGKFVEIKSENRFAPNNLPKSSFWWDINKFSSECFSIQKENQTILLEKTLRNVLKEQSKADVNTAAFLSGGIDSSLITSLLQTQSSQRIKTFNISFPEKGYGEEEFNEGKYSKAIANFLNTDHTEIALSWNEAQSIIPNLQNIYTEPFADSSQVATFLICQEVRNKGIKVAFGGDGADELFGGYNRHTYIPSIYQNFKNFPKPIKIVISKLIKYLEINKGGISHEQKRKLAYSIKYSHDLNSIYDVIISNEYNINRFLNYEQFQKKEKELSYNFSAPTISENIMIKDIKKYLPNNILVKLDRASMHTSLETRSPFLDERVSRIAISTKLNNKIKNTKNKKSSKYILKQILYSIVPEKFFNRPKTGFSLPINIWLKGPLKDWANDLLSEELIKRQGYLSSKYIKEIWESHQKGDFKNTELLWTILMWQSWFNKWEKMDK